MAIQLSAYLWLRNNDLVPWATESHPNYPSLTEKEKKTLKFIVDEIDDLHSGSYFENVNKPVIGENVLLPGYVRCIEKSKAPETSGQLFEGIHNIIQNYWVDPQVYRRLGDSFEDLGLKVPKDIAGAVEYAQGMIRRKEIPGHRCDKMRWEIIKKKRENEKNGENTRW